MEGGQEDCFSLIQLSVESMGAEEGVAAAAAACVELLLPKGGEEDAAKAAAAAIAAGEKRLASGLFGQQQYPDVKADPTLNEGDKEVSLGEYFAAWLPPDSGSTLTTFPELSSSRLVRGSGEHFDDDLWKQVSSCRICLESFLWLRVPL